MIKFFIALGLMATPALAQVMAPGTERVCDLRADVIKALTERYGEIPYFSGVEGRSKTPFTWYVNFKTKTSSYVTFPSPGIACFVGGIEVGLAERKSDT
jgi:hypothetical protein